MEAFRARDYERAIHGFKAEIASNPENAIASGGLGVCLFALGRYAEAIPYIAAEGESERARIKGSPGMDLKLSAAYWCAGLPMDAVNLMSKLVSDVSRRKVTYSNDQVGGVIYGLYLFYYATMIGDSDLAQTALPFMKKLNEKQIGKSRFNTFPLPIARQVLGVATFEEVLLAQFEVYSLAEVRKIARTSLLVHGRLCETLFWDGVLAHVSGDPGKFMDRDARCS